MEKLFSRILFHFVQTIFLFLWTYFGSLTDTFLDFYICTYTFFFFKDTFFLFMCAFVFFFFQWVKNKSTGEKMLVEPHSTESSLLNRWVIISPAHSPTIKWQKFHQVQKPFTNFKMYIFCKINTFAFYAEYTVIFHFFVKFDFILWYHILLHIILSQDPKRKEGVFIHWCRKNLWFSLLYWRLRARMWFGWVFGLISMFGLTGT